MAQYLPPTENLPIFNSSVFDRSNEGLTLEEAYTKFLAFPISQGSEEITGDLTIDGTTYANSNVNIAGNLSVDDDTTNITVNIGNNNYNNGTLEMNGDINLDGNINWSGSSIQNTGLRSDGTDQYCIAGAETITNNPIPHITAFGANALKDIQDILSSYHDDTAIGANSLMSETTGYANTAIGYDCLKNLTTGQDNIGIGAYTGSSIVTTNYNICIGNNADVIDDTITDSIVIGHNATATGDNQIMLGSSTQYVKIPNYIEFADGTTQNTAGGGGGVGTLNQVLAAGNTATNKTAFMFGSSTGSSNNMEFSGDGIELTGAGTEQSILSKSNLTLENGGLQSDLSNSYLTFYENYTSPLVNNNNITNSDITITGATSSIKNTITPTSYTITDGISTNTQTDSFITLKGVSNTVNYSSIGQQTISIIGNTVNDTVGMTTGTNSYLTATDSTNSAIIYTDSVVLNTNATPTTNKNTINTSGMNIIGASTTSTTSLTDGSLDISTSGFNSNLTPSLLTMTTSTSATTDKSTLSRSSLQIIGSTINEYSGISSTYATVVDPSNTSILESDSLTLSTTGSTFNKNVMTNTSSVLTGSSSSITNTNNATSHTITNGTNSDTLTSSSITLNLNASPSVNKNVLTNSSSVITGSSSAITNTINATSSKISDSSTESLITSSAVKLYNTGSPNINYNTMDSYGSTCMNNTGGIYSYSTYNYIDEYDTDNARYCRLSSGGLSGTGNSVNTTSQFLYMGGTQAALSANTSNAMVLTNSDLSLYNANNARTTNKNVMTNSSSVLTGSSSSITNTRNATSETITDGTDTNTLTSSYHKIYKNATPSVSYSYIDNNGLQVYANPSTTWGYLTATDNNFMDATNSRYAMFSSGGLSTTGNSVLTNKQFLYLGNTDALQSAGASNAMVLTNSDLSLYNANNARTNNYVKASLTGTSGQLICSQSGYTTTINGASILVQSGSVSTFRVDGSNTSNQVFMENGINVAPSSSVSDILIRKTGAGTGLTGAGAVTINRSKGLQIGDYIGQFKGVGVVSGQGTFEWGNMSILVKNISTGNIDGAIEFNVLKNNTLTKSLDINGDDSQINAFQPLDMNGNSIVSSVGNMTIDASGSSGTGIINLTTKDGTAGSGAGLVLTGNTLTAGSAGGASGQHLCLTINGVVYKIALLNA